MRTTLLLTSFLLFISSCKKADVIVEYKKDKVIPEITHRLSSDQTHNKFSSKIPPVISVKSGAVIEAYTEEATDKQFDINSSVEDVKNLMFDPIHPLTGPVYVEEAEVGDVIAVTLHKIELGDWGWTAISPGFGFLADEFTEAKIKTFKLSKNMSRVKFNKDISIPLNPFPGVLGVAPETNEMLSTIPPRVNGGNVDDPSIIEGTTVYLPVLVKGALFSIGDTHAVQGFGEVCGTALEAPMRIVYEIKVIKNRPDLKEMQYERDDIYAVTAFATTIDEAAKKATKYMIEYLVKNKNLSREDAYMLCSLAGDLKIAEVVDVPHVLVTMHMPKNIFKE